MSKIDVVLDGTSIVASLSNPVLSAVLEGGKLSLGVIRQLYPNADDNMTRFINEEVQQAVFGRLPEIERRLIDIEAKLDDCPSATQLAIVYKAFVYGFGKADGKKRTLLLNALVNAFDPELYEQSLTGRLFALMDDLDYPDLQYLMRVESGPDKMCSPWADPRLLDGYHATRLVNAGLMAQRGDTAALVSGLGSMMVKLIRDSKMSEL